MYKSAVAQDMGIARLILLDRPRIGPSALDWLMNLRLSIGAPAPASWDHMATDAARDLNGSASDAHALPPTVLSESIIPAAVWRSAAAPHQD
jgi:hypothetical protein